MSDSGKDFSTDQAARLPANLPIVPQNVALAIRQRLVSLKWAGIKELPKADGQFQFPGLILYESKSSTPSIVGEQPASKSNFVSKTPLPGRPRQETSTRGTSQQAALERQPANILTSTVGEPSGGEPSGGESAGGEPEGDTCFPPADSYGPAVPIDERKGRLDVVRQEVAACTVCSELASTRTQIVFGVGAVQPRLVFLGEAPGADEDRLGEPFVGAAGQLLNKIIEAMGLAREDVYILNTLKCRPPGNRNPQETELRNCCGYAVRQLEILQPEIICCLGSIAAKTMLGTKRSIGRMRGQFYRWRGSRVVVTYHPAYLLRTPSAKKHVWTDMKLIMSSLGERREL